MSVCRFLSATCGLLMLVLTGPLLLAQEVDPQQFPRLFSLLYFEGPKHIQAGRYQAAERLVADAIKTSQQSQIPLDALPVVRQFRLAGQTDVAIRLLKQLCATLEPPKGQAGLEAEDALWALKRGFLLRPALAELAVAYTEAGQLDAARRSLAQSRAAKNGLFDEIANEVPEAGLELNVLRARLPGNVPPGWTEAEVLLLAREKNRDGVLTLFRTTMGRRQQGQQARKDLQKAFGQVELAKSLGISLEEEPELDEDEQLADSIVDLSLVSALGLIGDTESASKLLDGMWQRTLTQSQSGASGGGRYEQAVSLEARDLTRTGFGPKLPSGLEARAIRHRGFSLAVQSPRASTVLAKSAEWLANDKANGHDKDLAYNILLASNKDPEVSKLVKQLHDAQRLIAAKTYAGLPDAEADALDAHWGNRFFADVDRSTSSSALEGVTSRLDMQLQVQLRLGGFILQNGLAPQMKQREQLAKDLFQRHVGRSLLGNSWVTLAGVREQLQPGEFLVDLAEFQWHDFPATANQSLWKGRRYAAWIVPPAGNESVQVVDLGSADKIDVAIDRVLNAMKVASQPSGPLQQLGDREAERLLRNETHALAELIWEPVATSLAHAKQIILSPDGKLWLFPWEALPVGDDEFLIEKIPIRYVVSARDLWSGSADLPSMPPVIVANPDFDKQTNPAIAPKPPGRAPLVRGAQFKELRLLPRVDSLPATAAEADAITPSLEEFAGQTPELLTAENATEAKLCAVQSPHTLVLATHGFVLDSEKVWNRRGFDNPLMRAGVLLAGCNVCAGQIDDGVLTASEAMGLNLVGTRLVVLSACETAVGDVREGETIAGLRQAFHLAGAKAVVATAWSIPDVESSRLMKEFFGNLAQGQLYHNALRQAQLTRIQARREKFGSAHPFFWAAYTMTGTDPRKELRR